MTNAEIDALHNIAPAVNPTKGPSLESADPQAEGEKADKGLQTSTRPRKTSVFDIPSSVNSQVCTAQPAIVCSGWVWKRGDWRNPSYKKRWFVLFEDGALDYFSSPNDPKTDRLGSLHCRRMHVEEDAGSNLQGMHRFAITGKGTRRLVLACPSLSERALWYHTIPTC